MKRKVHDKGSRWGKGIILLFWATCISVIGFSQAVTNTGKEFWVGYGHHEFMEGSCDGLSAGANDMNMKIYLSNTSTQVAHITLTIDSSGLPNTGLNWFTRTYTVNPGFVVETENMPKGPVNSTNASGNTDPNYDARLWTERPPAGTGGEGLFRSKGIHIVSDVPIVAYAHIFGSTSSGATMLLPIESWGYSYTSVNSEQKGYSKVYSWMYVIAKEDNTVVEITPSALSRMGKPAWVPFQITLMKGQIYQLIGDAVCSTGEGVQLTGTKIRSISGGFGDCKPIAVFSGCGRTGGEETLCGFSSKDNDMQQCYPQQAWGTRYLTAPFSSASGSSLKPADFQTSVYKVAVKDPATLVKKNGVLLSASTVSVSIIASATSICPGTSVKFTAIPINGGTAPTYQWKIGGVNVPGGTNATYITDTLKNNDVVTCSIISDVLCANVRTASSNSLTITVANSVVPSVAIYATSEGLCGSNPIVFKALPTNGGTASYQWQLNGGSVGTNSDTYTLSSAAAGNTVKCIMTSTTACISATSATSNVITLNNNATITPAITIKANVDVTQPICAGQPVTFTATPTNGGSAPTYQWQVKDYATGTTSNVGTNSSTFTISTLAFFDEVSCVLTSSAACASPANATSNSIQVIIGNTLSPTMQLIASSSSLCGSTTTKFFAVPQTNYGTVTNYQWYVNGSPVGTNGLDSTFTYTGLKEFDQVRCTLTSNAGCLSTANASAAVVMQTPNLINRSYYIYISNTADYIEADKAVMVAQYMSQGSNCGALTSSDGDPEMVFLSPIDQGIKKAVFYSTSLEQIRSNFVTVILPTKALSSLRLNNSSVFDYTYSIANKPGYSVAIKGWAATKKQWTLTCDSGFNATTYGLGGAESYGYNAGTNLNNIDGLPAYHNLPDTSALAIVHPYTYVGSPMLLRANIAFRPTQMVWRLSYLGCSVVTPCTDVTVVNPIPNDSTIIGTAKYYQYTLPGNYVFNIPGTYNLPIELTVPNLDNGNCNNKETVTPEILVKYKPSMLFTYTQAIGCGVDTVRFKADTITPELYKIIKYKWQFTGNIPDTSNLQNPSFYFTTPGVYPVKLSIVTINGGIADTTINVTVTAGNKPHSNFGANPNTICLGQPINFKDSTGYFPDPDFSYWDFGNGYRDTVPFTTIDRPYTYNAIGTYIVRHTLMGSSFSCLPDTVNRTVVVAPTPNITGASGVSPTTCGGSDGKILLTGLQANGTYVVKYTFNTVVYTVTATVNSSGVLTVPNLAVGTYSNINTSIGTCISNSVGPVTLTSPAPPAQPTASSNTPVCVNSQISLIATPFITGGTYAWTGPNGFTSSLPNPTIANATTAANGTYSVTVTLNNCTSTAGTTIVAVNNLPAITNPTVANPTSCATATGSITLNGLLSATAYTVNYTSSGGAQTATITSTASGAVVIPNLLAGTYSNITVTYGCTSNAVGPFTLSDPNPPATPVASVLVTPICAGNTINLSATSSTSGVTFEWSGPNSYTATGATPAITNAPTTASGSYTVVAKLNGCTSLASNAVSIVVNPIPATPVASSNSPICAGITLNLTSSNVTGTATYVWSGPNSFNSASVNPSIANATPAATGAYSFTVTQNGCTSAASTPINVVVNAIPAIASTTVSNPTTCATSTGSITLNGLLASTIYTVNYTSSTGAQTATLASNASGAVVIPNLAAGNYTNISVTLNTCVSNIVGPLSLSDPNPPATPVASVLVTPICAGNTINLSATSSTSGISFEWSGPNSYTATGATPAITNAPTTASGSYTVVAKLNGCTSLASNAVSVVVNPIPATPVASSNSPICAGTTLSLTSSNVTGTATYTWSGPNSFSSASANPSIANATPAATGAYSFTVTQNGCTSAASAPTNVTVNAVPVISGASLSNTTTCSTATGSITLNGLLANTAYNVVYTSSTASLPTTVTITSGSTGSVVITNLTAGTYSNISVTLNNCTSNIVGPFTLTDPTPPVAPTVTSNNSPVCSGTAIILTANSSLSGVTYTWTTPGGSSITGATLTVNNSAATDAGTYAVTVTQNSCVSPPVTTNVTVKPTPTVTSSSSTNPTTCATATGSITLNGLTAGTAYTVNYTKNSTVQSATITANGSGAVVIPNLAAATYAGVTLTLNGCTSTAAGPFVLSDPNPPATPVIVSNPATTICTGNNLTLTASTATSGAIVYTWTSSNGFSAAGTNPVVFNNATAAVAGTYSVTATLNSCVSAAASVTITVNPTPAITSSSAINPTDCASATGSITLRGLTANTAYTVDYTKNTAAQTATLSSNAAGVITIPALTAGTYSNITVTLNACPSNVVGPFTLTDPAAPGVSIVSNNSPLCEGATVNIIASSPATGATFAWTSTNGYTTTGNAVNITNATTANSGTYTVTATKNNCTSTATAVMQVNPIPAASFTMPAFVCMPNGVVNFTNTSTVVGNGSMTYTWDFGDGSPTSSAVNGSHTYTAMGSYPVKLVTTASGCSNSATNTFSAFYDKPIAAFKIDKDTVCQGVSNVFTDLSTAPNSTITNWTWNFGDGSTSVASAPTKLYTLPGSYPVTLTVKNAQGCSSDPLVKNIKVYLQPKIDAGTFFMVPQGTTVVMNPTTNDSTTVTFMWTPASHFAHPDSLRASLMVMQNQIYTLTATGQGKCQASDTVSVVALKPFIIPNAFSPNGDGINDKWEIGNLADYTFASVEIFNRNGQSVFKSRGYSQPWDGTYNGKPLPVGTYYYIIDFMNTFPRRSGYVVILR